MDIVEPRTLDEVKSCESYGPGETIFHQGDPCQGLHYVLDGCVTARRADARGGSRIVRLVWPGDLLGYCSYFAGSVQTASAVAAVPSRVCFIEGTKIERLREEYPALAEKFLHLVAADLAEAWEHRFSDAMGSVRARLSRVLDRIVQRMATTDEQGVTHVDLPLSRQDLAALVGARPETIARVIHSLEADGVAHFEGRHVTISDLDLLLDAAEQDR